MKNSNFYYTKTLWNHQWLDYNNLLHGRYRVFLRFFFGILRLGFEIFCLTLSIGTLTIDTVRWMRSRYLFKLHFVKMYKPYTLQQYRL